MDFLYVYVGLIYLSAVVSLLLAVYAWNRPDTDASISFGWLMGNAAAWCLCRSLALSSKTLEYWYFWGFSIIFIFVSAAPVMYLIFILTITRRKKWLTPMRISLLFIIPFITQIMNWTSGSHTLFLTVTQINRAKPFLYAGDMNAGVWFWIHTGYSYLLLFTGILLLIKHIARTRYPYCSQSVLI